MTTGPTLNELSAALDRSTDDLLVDLAQSSTSGGLPFDREHLKSIGEVLFQSWWDRIRDQVCRRYREIDSTTEDRVRDAAAVADVLIGLSAQLPVPVVTLAVLVVKYGLDTLCRVP